MKKLSATVVVLGLISFLTDLSSHMIFPLLPVFLTEVLGAGVLALGVIEGLAESTAACLKLASGYWADRVRRRKPFLLVGYGLAGLMRPLIGLATAWPVVLGLRFADRMGKGVRSAPRDAMIADVTPADRLGMAYGYHRAMDFAGTVAGPLVASLLLTGMGVSLRGVFLWAFVPAGLVMVLIVFGLREPSVERETNPVPAEGTSRRGFRLFAEPLPPALKRFLPALALFTLGHASDAFLLLALHQAGYTPVTVAMLWAAHNLLKTATALLAGVWTDRYGSDRLILVGWVAQAGVFLAFALLDSPLALTAIFLGYGLIKAVSQPAEKTFVAQLAPRELRGTLFGWYHFTVGLTALPAGLLFGWMWQTWGRNQAFAVESGLILLAVVVLWFAQRRPEP